MTFERKPNGDDDQPFDVVLEKGIRALLRSRRAKSDAKLAAIKTGIALVAARNRVANGGVDEDKGFFK